MSVGISVAESKLPPDSPVIDAAYNIFDLDPSTSAKEQFKPADAVFGY